ncbi:MAG TPA: diacylglycerol kinase family protein [Solirubrobacterales bacterium]|jgi:YegS/Rv2252/BmrU family lipid kinase|nr:diacylglycerol kinase family protein [Solirubrobacterales bacterium]
MEASQDPTPERGAAEHRVADLPVDLGPDEPQPLVLLVNPSSGGGRALKLLPRVEAVLDARRVPFRVVRTKGLDHGISRALRAIEGGETPVVLSGDGMVGAIGGAMAGQETPLGIVPGGRGNDLARVLGIPTDPEGAIEVVLAGHSRAIDVGEANGKPFLGIASVGFDSDANRRANEARFVRGTLVYLYAALRTMATWKSARFTIVIGEERTRMEGYDVVVANNKAYGGGMFIAPDAELDDGKFDVVTIADMGKLRALYNLTKVFKGTHVRIDEVNVIRASRLGLTASRPFAVYADGEHVTDLPADLRIIPRALRVLVPPTIA